MANGKQKGAKLAKLLDQIQQNRLEMATQDLTSLPKDVREMVDRKRVIYAEAAKLRLEHEKINDALMGRPELRNFRNLLCW